MPNGAGADVVDLAKVRWQKEHAAARAALLPFVEWEPWPHPRDDAPPELLKLHSGLAQRGVDRGWVS